MNNLDITFAALNNEEIKKAVEGVGDFALTEVQFLAYITFQTVSLDSLNSTSVWTNNTEFSIRQTAWSNTEMVYPSFKKCRRYPILFRDIKETVGEEKMIEIFNTKKICK